MCDTVGEEMQKWIDEIKKDAINLGSIELANHVCELEYYLLAMMNGVSIEEDSGVATNIMNLENFQKVQNWSLQAIELKQKIK